jgi:acetolactate synthase I/II/III large subunit
MTVFTYTGADLIADFIAERCCGTAFLVTGGACAFIVDAVGRNPKTEFVCFQHEQAAAMAADAIWRTTGKLGVTIATSGPGATNLITGIACSWFDSIPSLHITGQVNQSESREALGANVRQAGFQETDISSIVSSVTKFAKKAESVEELVELLPKVLSIATTGRMGPVLLDIPMNIQKAAVTNEQKMKALTPLLEELVEYKDFDLTQIISESKRPVVIIGAGAALSGSARHIQDWCEELEIPYVTSWGALTYIDRSAKNYFGSVGVYGSRAANWIVQSADQLIVFGSRLDNRQRTGNPFGFAPFAKVTVFDIDEEELLKYSRHSNFSVIKFDLNGIRTHLPKLNAFHVWSSLAAEKTSGMKEGFDHATKSHELNPYTAVRVVQTKFEEDSIVVSDCGANLCWVYQSYLADSTFLFTAGGNSPMGYSLPAAIGAQLLNPTKKVYCFIGDGGLQMNIQELQTIVAYNLPITIFIQNNFGYGIIKQFQDAYFESRHYATGQGYTLPDFKKVSEAYKIPYTSIDNEEALKSLKISPGYSIIDIQLPANSLITPKTEMDRFIHDQFPYIEDGSIDELMFNYPKHPSELSGFSNPTV